MLPQVNLTGNVGNPGTGGVLNPLPNIDPLTGAVRDRSAGLNPELIGGYGNILRQIFSVPTLNYSIGFQINIPLRNRSAQAQMQQQTFQLRQAELQYQAQTNQIRADVQNAQVNIETARERYKAAQEARVLQEQTLDNEQKKLQLGASTVFQVIQTQQNLANARQQEVTAQVAYASAKLQMDVATGNLMEKYNIVFDEARDGRIARRPDPIPVVLQNQGAAVRPATPATTPR
jgi:outer membrane protein TolC